MTNSYNTENTKLQLSTLGAIVAIACEHSDELVKQSYTCLGHTRNTVYR
jgi:hypothetical protein